MGHEVEVFKSEETKSRTEISEFLRGVAEQLAAGEVVLRSGDQELRLHLPEQLILEIQVEDEDKGSKGIQHSLEMEIKWFDAQPPNAVLGDR